MRARLDRAIALRAIGCVLGLLTVAPLLAWLWGWGRFATWYWVMAPLVLVGLGSIAWLSARNLELSDVRAALVSGFFGGLLGTIGYDLFRVPFVVFGGVQLFAPIQSFGILALNSASSSHATDWAGWSDHFFNGIGFGIAYAMVALGRRWPWGILWGCTLETLTLVTPYAREYGLVGHWDLIGLALCAHLVYGSLLGIVVQRGRAFTANADHVSRWATLGGIVALVVALALWLRPDRAVADLRTPADSSAGVRTVLNANVFTPQWIRVAPAECVLISNHDDQRHQLSVGGVIKARADATVCVPTTGSVRVRVDNVPYSGGFLLVDPDAP